MPVPHDPCVPASPPRPRARAAALLLALTLPLPVHAQEPAPPGPQPAAAETAPAPDAAGAELPAVKVRDTAEETATAPVPGYAARRSATATRTDTPLLEVPQAITVVTADQLADQDAQTMQEALRYSAGVRAETYGLDNRGDWFTLRGSSEGAVLLDGLRLPLTGWYGVVRNEPYAFERVEVLRGPSSVVAGQNAPGGVVNLVSKRPQPVAAREVVLQGGSNGHKQAALDLTGPAGDGALLYRLVAVGQDSGTQVRHAGERRLLVAPSLSWTSAGGTGVTAFAEYQVDRSGNVNGFFPIAGTLAPAPNGRIPVDTFVSEPDWDRYGGSRVRAGYALEQPLGGRFTLRHQLRHDRVDGEHRSMYADFFSDPVWADGNGDPDPSGRHLNRIWYAADDTGRVTAADLLLEGRLELGPTRHTLLVGADGVLNAMDQRSWDGGHATPLDVYDPVYGSFPEPDLANLPSGLTETRLRAAGLFAQDQLKLGERLVVTAGLRLDRTRTDTDTRASDGARGEDRQDDTALTKRLGVVLLAGGGLAPYASYAESFEPLPGTDAAGATFDPKRGRQVEAGVKWAPATSRLSAAAAGYWLTERNRLTGDPANPGFSVQRGEVTVKGLELEAAADLRALELVASYALTDARQTRGSASDARYLDEQLAGIPRHSASLWAVHRLDVWGLAALRGLRAGAGLRYSGETTDGTGGTPVPAVVLLDLLASYDRGPWRVALNVANATDDTYVATCLERGDCWYGTKRKTHLSAAYRW